MPAKMWIMTAAHEHLENARATWIMLAKIWIVRGNNTREGLRFPYAYRCMYVRPRFKV